MMLRRLELLRQRQRHCELDHHPKIRQSGQKQGPLVYPKICRLLLSGLIAPPIKVSARHKITLARCIATARASRKTTQKRRNGLDWLWPKTLIARRKI